MAHRPVWIRGREHRRRVAAIARRGPWAITPHAEDVGRYNVTHVPSGLGVFSGFNCGLTLTRARKALRLLAEMSGNWRLAVNSAEDLTPEQRKAGRAVRVQFEPKAGE